MPSQVDIGRSKASPSADPAPSSKKNVLAHEVRVLATGARPSENSAERELFTEETTSVLVFEKGGVIRLSAAVIPGQLLFLTNQESKREVVAQVTHKRNNRPTSCYVELEFTESSPGFWGVEIPKSPERSQKNAKHVETAALVQSAEVTADEPHTPPPSPDAREVERLKNEVEALRRQLESLRETQRAAVPPAVKITSEVPLPVVPEVPSAAPPQAEMPLVVAPSKPSSTSPKDSTSSVPQISSEGPTKTPTNTQVPPATAAPTAPSPSAPVANAKFASSKPSVDGPEPATAAEDTLPKPSLNFSQAAVKATLPRRNVIGDVPSRRSRRTRTALLLAALFFVAASAAWNMNWLPWVPPMQNVLPGSPSSLGRGSHSSPAVSSAPPRTSTPHSPAGSAKQISETPALSSGSAPASPTNGVATTEPLPNSESVAAKSNSTEHETTSSIVENPSPASSKSKQILLRSSSKAPSVPPSVSAGASGFLPPKLIRSMRPVVPPQALRDFVTGNVTVDATVDSNGRVKTAKVLSGPQALRKAALDAVKKYRYDPAMQNGKAVPAHVEVTIQFWFEP